MNNDLQAHEMNDLKQNHMIESWNCTRNQVYNIISKDEKAHLVEIENRSKKEKENSKSRVVSYLCTLDSFGRESPACGQILSDCNSYS